MTLDWINYCTLMAVEELDNRERYGWTVLSKISKVLVSPEKMHRFGTNN